MRTKYPRILGVFAAILMVASFVVPTNLATPAPVSADPGIMKWDYIQTPYSKPLSSDVDNYHATGISNTGMGSEVVDLVAGGDGNTLGMIVRDYWYPSGSNLFGDPYTTNGCTDNWQSLWCYSNNSGISSTNKRSLPLLRKAEYQASTTGFEWKNWFQVAVAPDDPKYFAVTTDNGTCIQPLAGRFSGPRQIWVTADAGANWDLAFNGMSQLDANETIKTIDISIDYGGRRDIAFGTVGGTVGGRWAVRSSTGFTTWTIQDNPNGVNNGASRPAFGAATNSACDYQDIKFSPTYNGDSSVAIVYSSQALWGAAQGTFYNVAWRDLASASNLTTGFAFGFPGIEVRRPDATPFCSPQSKNLNKAMIQLPSDFSGQSASLRRVYISLDAWCGGGGGPGAVAKAINTLEDGIFRIDDSTQYVLMNTTSDANKSIYSIAYFGTYASGKLLAGERMGFPCTATVPTWFTDSPTTCPIPCWYPALKPTTGAANQPGICGAGNHDGVGAALVAWNADGSLGYVGTSSLPYIVNGTITGSIRPAGNKYEVVPPYNVPTVAGASGWFWPLYFDATNNDETALAISRNNGETWNQIFYIDTTIDWFNDVAVAPDCTTLYLASVNRNVGTANWCNEFDSVWRTTINPNVAAPLPAVPPLGTYWERVYCRTTSANCAAAQSDLPILRLVPSCSDKKDGELVGWAAQGTTAMAWSPDYGDFWSNVTARNTVQDFAFESSTTMYVLSDGGLVQRMPYTGTAWSSTLPSSDTLAFTAHTIAAYPEGKVLVGGGTGSPYMVMYSLNKGETFSLVADPPPASHGNEHVIFDVDFKNNSFIYVGDDSASLLGTVYRNTIPSWSRWINNDMMTASNGNGYQFVGAGLGGWATAPSNEPPHIVGQFGIAQAFTGNPQPALYSAHAQLPVLSIASLTTDSAVCRAIYPRDGMPKPGIWWDCLDIFTPLNITGVAFTLEPTSLKYCGCCTLDTNTTLYAIDNESGGVSARSGRFKMNPGYAPTLTTAPRGLLWAYTDCLAKKGPVLKSPADKFLVGADPVTGRNQQIDLSWEQLCLSTYYQLQVAKDKDFTLRINPSQTFGGVTGTGVPIIAAVTGSILIQMDTFNMTSPAMWISPGALPEAGAIYWWRIRSAKSATQQIAASPWSDARSFTVKAGFIVNTPYYGVQLLSPNNGCLGCKTKPASFSWSPWKEATKYQIDIAKDPEFKAMLVTATTTTTAYAYQGTLDYSTNYFWRVKALEVNAQAIPSDWSATFSFQTEPAPAPPAPPPAEPATPLWVWIIIAIGAILVIVTLILIFKTRRV